MCCVQGVLRGCGGAAQFGDLGAQLVGVVQGQLFLGLLQRHLGHARVDLQALERVAGRGRRGGRRRGLRGLGAGGLVGARLAFGVLLFFGAAQAFLAQLEALLGMLGLLLFLLQLADFALGRAEVLHQRDVRRADVGAGAAFDAVEQVVRLELFVLLAEGEEMQLLRQQAGRAGLGALAAADARQRRRGRRQLLDGAGQQAVAGLDQRHVEGGQRETHHRPAEDQAVQPCFVQPGKFQ